MAEKLLNAIKKALDRLLFSFFDKDISEEELLSELNKAIHYNIVFTPYIYEMFYIQALEINKIPCNKAILAGLFKNIDPDYFLISEEFDVEGTRIKVLKKLGLEKTLKVYNEYLICHDNEPHTLFKDGENNPIYKEAVKNKPTINDVFNCLMEEAE